MKQLLNDTNKAMKLFGLIFRSIVSDHLPGLNLFTTQPQIPKPNILYYYVSTKCLD